MERSGLNATFSEICNYDFSDCEGGEIENVFLQKCYNLAVQYETSIPTICTAFCKAIEFGTFLELEY